MAHYFEVWTRPGDPDFGRVIDDPTFREASIRDAPNQLGGGNFQMPSSFTRFDDILKIDGAASVSSLVRVWDDTTTPDSIVYEWLVDSVQPTSSKNDPYVDVSGSGIKAILTYPKTQPYDWDGSLAWACSACDWIWGGQQVLSNPGFEESFPVATVYILNITATGGSFTLTDGTDTTSAIGAPFTDLAVTIANEIEADITALPDVVVDRTSIANPTYTIRFVSPPFGPTLAVNTGSLTGGTATMTLDTAGFLDVSPWTLEYNFADTNPGIPESWTFQAATSPVRTGTYSLEVKAPPTTPISNRNPGIQQIISVKPNQIYQGSVWVWPTSATDRFRLYLATPGEEVVATSGNTGTTLTPGQWNEITLVDVTIPPGVTQVAFRLDQPNPDPYTFSTYFVDDASFFEGFAPTSAGGIVEVLYGTYIDPALWPTIVWDDGSGTDTPYLTLDFDDVNDSNGDPWVDTEIVMRVYVRQTLWMVLTQLAGSYGIEFRVVPDDEEAGTWLLQMFNPEGMGTDYSAAATPAIQGGSSDTNRRIRRFLPNTWHMVEGLQRLTARASDAGLLSALGFIGGERIARGLPDLAGVEAAAAEDATTTVIAGDYWSYELVLPQAVPGTDYVLGDTLAVHDPPEVDGTGRFWDWGATFTPEGGETHEVQFVVVSLESP